MRRARAHRPDPFELRFLDLDEVPASDEAMDLLVEDVETWGAPLTDRLAGLCTALESRYPWRPEAPGVTPWASWPPTGPLAGGRCIGANLRGAAATRNTLAGIYQAAAAAQVTVYDPQAGTVTLPNGSTTAVSRTAPGRSGRHCQVPKSG